MEHPALRGLAAIVIAFFAALFLTAKWGHRGPLAAKAHWVELARVAASVTALLLPALFAGATTTEVEALATLLQAAIGWRSPAGPWAWMILLLVAAYVATRLKHSVRERRLVGGGLVAVSSVICAALVVSSAGRLLLIPAMSGFERLAKTVLLLVVGTIGSAALLPGKSGARSFDPRTIALAVGLVGAGLLSSFAAYRYLRPAVGDIERVRFTQGDGTGTTFAALLDSRPDIYGLFSLEYASATPRLALVRSLDEAADDLLEPVHRTFLGTARLVPRPPQNARERRAPPLEASFEVWIRLRWWPWSDLRPGLWIGEPVYDWAVAPGARLAVSTTFEGSADSWLNPWRSEVAPGTYAVVVWRGAGQSRKLLDNLAQAPRILDLTNTSVRLLGSSAGPTASFAAQSFPPPANWQAALTTTTCNLTASTCEPWQIGPNGDARPSRPEDRILSRGYGTWSLLDTRTLATVLRAPRQAVCGGDCDHAYLLRDGRVVQLLLLGSMPNWDARLSAFDATGRETVVTAMGNVRLTRFAGELDDGTVAIAWRAQYAWSYTNPVFGWTLDAWNPATGERRRLADDLATFPAADNDASTIFLDRQGQLVVPAIDGVRVVTQLGYLLPLN